MGAALAAILSANKEEVGEVVSSEVVSSLSQGDDSLDGQVYVESPEYN